MLWIYHEYFNYQRKVNGVCRITHEVMLSVGTLPINLSCEHTGITLYCFRSYSTLLTTQDWRTHIFWTQQNETIVKSLQTHTHRVLHSSLVPWGIVLLSLLLIIKNTICPSNTGHPVWRVLEDPWAHCFWLLTPTPKW